MCLEHIRKDNETKTRKNDLEKVSKIEKNCTTWLPVFYKTIVVGECERNRHIDQYVVQIIWKDSQPIFWQEKNRKIIQKAQLLQ